MPTVVARSVDSLRPEPRWGRGWLRVMTAALVSLASLHDALAGELSPRFFLMPKDQPMVRVHLQLEKGAEARLAPRLSALRGSVVNLPEDGVARLGQVLSAEIPWTNLKRLAALPGVRRIEPARPLLLVRPLSKTAPMVGSPEVWSPPASSVGSDGSGVLIADHEGGWEIFHPDFFFPDGGLFTFEDHDANGRAGPGDRLDLDGDGQFEAELSLLEGVRRDMYTQEEGIREPGYQPDIDWLYVDSNSNRQRDFGAGFAEDTPGLGEPIFVGDDINGDGVIAGGERLVRLGRSKVRAVWQRGTVFERGERLAQYHASASDSGHGTGAIGIAAGGWPELRRYTGVAPGAELLLVNAEDDAVAGLSYALSRGAKVNFFEWDSPMDFGDGSSPTEEALSAAKTSGAVQVTATGNLASADHVARLPLLTENQPAHLRISTASPDGVPFGAFWLSLCWRGDPSAIAVRFTLPGGASLDLDGSEREAPLDAFKLQWIRDQSSRGIAQLIAYATPRNGAGLPETQLTLTLTSSTNIAEVRGILFDDRSGWSRGVAWLDEQSDIGTALMPSTADDVIAVGAYGGNHDLSPWGFGAPGERRAYSGVGPRIDGAPLVDLLAPDDPFSPASDPGDPHGAYGAFGGTSGALPHVAGGVALLVGAGLSGHEVIERRLKETAVADALIGPVPSEPVGFGKVHFARALFGQARPAGDPPAIHLELGSPAVQGHALIVNAVIQSQAGPVTVEWDVGYDRTYEEPRSERTSLELLPDRAGQLPIVARAIDQNGRSARALLLVAVAAPCTSESCHGCCSPDGTCGACEPPPVDAGSVPDGGSSPDGGRIPLDERPREDGCGCRVTDAAEAPRWPAGLMLLLLGWTAWGRRRRR